MTRREIPRWVSAVRGFNTVTHYLAGVGLMALLFLTVTDILGRTLLSRPVPGTVEVTSMLLVVVVFLAVAHSEDMGDHITIDLIYERVGPRWKMVMDLFADVLSIIVIGLLSFQLYQFVLRNQASGAETPVLDLPIWPFVLVAAFGTALYAVSTAIRMTLRLMGLPVDAVDPSDPDGGVEV